MHTPPFRFRLLALAALPVSLKASILYTSAEATTTGTDPLQFNLGTGAFGTGLSGDFFGINGGSNKPTLAATGSGQVISLSQLDIGASNARDFAVRFGAGENIDASARWNGSASPFFSKPNYAGTFNAGDRGYVGLRIPNGGGYNYGWADISHNVGDSLTLHSFAMETTVDTAIQAGAVPEPAETAFAAALAAGSVAAFRARRRRQSRRAAGH
jgi:hypothetical protein